MSPRRAIVVAGGEVESLGPSDASDALVIAADSGLDACLAYGLPVDIVVGDFDSVSRSSLDQARRSGSEVLEHPSDKDHTDLELALELAADRACTAVEVYGVGGGRIDHLLGNVAALLAAARMGADVVAHYGPARVRIVTGRRTLVGEPGDVASLLAVGGPAGPITTTGLRYPLEREVLTPWQARGVSNVFTGREATVDCDGGYLIVVQLPQAAS